MHRYILAALLGLLIAPGAQAETLRALAKLDMAASGITDTGQGVAVSLALTQPVPYRVYMLDAPMRVVIEFQEVAFAPDLGLLDRADGVLAVAGTRVSTGGSALVLELAQPLEVTKAALETGDDGRATVRVRLAPVTRDMFVAGTRTGENIPAAAINSKDARLVVALDPGHGGSDTGAQHGAASEAQLMLQFALELREALLRSGVEKVVLTRETDQFRALSARISSARAAGADLLLSLHADALAKPGKSQIRVYTLSPETTAQASEVLAERQDRLDMLSGVDLRAYDDQVATVLMDLARLDVAPRADRLADQLVASLDEKLGAPPARRKQAGFAVLKAPDIPSVLIELGALSPEQDRAGVLDPNWRAKAAGSIVGAVTLWALDEASRGQ